MRSAVTWLGRGPPPIYCIAGRTRYIILSSHPQLCWHSITSRCTGRCCVNVGCIFGLQRTSAPRAYPVCTYTPTAGDASRQCSQHRLSNMLCINFCSALDLRLQQQKEQSTGCEIPLGGLQQCSANSRCCLWFC